MKILYELVTVNERDETLNILCILIEVRTINKHMKYGQATEKLGRLFHLSQRSESGDLPIEDLGINRSVGYPPTTSNWS